MNKHPQSEGMNTPYDDAFKSIIKKCPALSLPLINELFYRRGLSEEQYTGKERIKLLDKELPHLGLGSLEMDIRLEVYGKTRKVYHLECESTADGTMVLRMIQYDMTSALQEADYENAIIRVRIDDSGVLYLRSSRNIRDVMTVEMTVPQNPLITYQLPVIKIQDYTLDSILERKLYILLPFLFFNYEKKLQKAREDQSIYDEINSLYGDILSHLQRCVDEGSISAYEASTLYDSLKIVFTALGKKNQSSEEVEIIMGGKLLEFSADKFYDAGKIEGLEEGRQEGAIMGEERLSDLLSWLNREGRHADCMRAIEDQSFRQTMYEEYNKSITHG